MNYTLDFAPVIAGLPDMLYGVLGTFGLALGGMALAVVIGIGGVVVRQSRFPPLRMLTIAALGVACWVPILVTALRFF